MVLTGTIRVEIVGEKYFALKVTAWDLFRKVCLIFPP